MKFILNIETNMEKTKAYLTFYREDSFDEYDMNEHLQITSDELELKTHFALCEPDSPVYGAYLAVKKRLKLL